MSTHHRRRPLDLPSYRQRLRQQQMRCSRAESSLPKADNALVEQPTISTEQLKTVKEGGSVVKVMTEEKRSDDSNVGSDMMDHDQLQGKSSAVVRARLTPHLKLAGAIPRCSPADLPSPLRVRLVGGSPLSAKIRRQILKSDEERMSSHPSSTTAISGRVDSSSSSSSSDPAAQSRRKRLEKNLNRLRLHSPRAATTPSADDDDDEAREPAESTGTARRATSSSRSCPDRRQQQPAVFFPPSPRSSAERIATPGRSAPLPGGRSGRNGRSATAPARFGRTGTTTPRTPRSAGSGCDDGPPSYLRPTSCSRSRAVRNQNAGAKPAKPKTPTTSAKRRSRVIPTPLTVETPFRVVAAQEATAASSPPPGRAPQSARSRMIAATVVVETASSTEDSSSTTTDFPETLEFHRDSLMASPAGAKAVERSHVEDGTSSSSPRRGLDMRSVRLLYADDFRREIAMCKATTSHRPSCERIIDPSSAVKVYVRKRPVLPHEENGPDFDVVHVIGDRRNDGSEPCAAVTVYRTSMDAKGKWVQAVQFSGCSAVFDETTDSDCVYMSAIEPMVEDVVHHGKAATVLMLGQRGSGKARTVTECQELLADHIFLSSAFKQQKVQLQCIELVGERCRDLMADGDADVRIVDNADGTVRLDRASCIVVKSPTQFLTVLRASQRRRVNQSTAKNKDDGSNRSHAVFQIRTASMYGSFERRSGGEHNGGLLTLIDFAGTVEQLSDTNAQGDSANETASLCALKECIRARMSTIPNRSISYRSSNLTRVMRESLESGDSQLAVIATVAPTAIDTEETIQTLETVSLLTGTSLHEGESRKLSSSQTGCYDQRTRKAPKDWTYSELVHWLTEQRLVGNLVVPGHVDGRRIMRMSKIELRRVLYDDEPMQAGVSKADILFQRLRAENDLVAQLDLKRQIESSVF